jgi:hypothetical protein
MFPTSIEQTKQIQLNSSKEIEWTLNFLKERLKQLKIDDITVSSNHVDFKKSFFNVLWNRDTMSMIDGGFFDYDNSTSIMTYKVDIKRTFFITLFMSVSIGFTTTSTLIVLGCFLFLFGSNYLNTLVRQRRLFKSLIDEIINTKDSIPNQSSNKTIFLGQSK